MEKEIKIYPIAYVRSDYKEKFGIPRQSGRAPSLLSRIVFTEEFRSGDALREIEGFSHLWLLFDFSATREKGYSPTVRPPRLGGNKRVGVFASRSPFRPNHIGLSCVKLVRLEKTNEGATLIVAGADLLDGTPILDIKPYLPYADCQIDATGGYTEDTKWQPLSVRFEEGLLEKIPEEKRAGLCECLEQDPRPSYQDDSTRVYGMAFDIFQIRFIVKENELTVIAIEN